MSWNPQMDAHYVGNAAPYNSAGSFVDFFAGLTFDHVNYIFAGASPMQETVYPSANMGYYKFGYSDPGAPQYYSNAHSYDGYDHVATFDEYRSSVEFPSVMTNENTTATDRQSETISNTSRNTGSQDCPRSHSNSHDFQVIWQDNIDPDNMTYEELLELGETVGTQSRGLSREQISLLPVSKFKCRFFLRKRSRSERCVICQMEYKRGDRLINLPCKHKYHVGCGTKWLSINKACPICYTEVSLGNARK